MEDHYIAGFVDGEGSFHIAFQRNPDLRIGWQAVPEFHVSQDVSSRHVLEAIRDRLDCGIIKLNHRGSRNDRTHVRRQKSTGSNDESDSILRSIHFAYGEKERLRVVQADRRDDEF